MAQEGRNSFEGEEIGRAQQVNGAQPPRPSEIEVDAERMLLAIDAIVTAELPDAARAERYASRLRFALTRVDELKRATFEEGGAFAPARLEVGMWILENQVQSAAAFVNRSVRQARRLPGRRSAHAEVEEAIAYVEEQQRDAA